MKKVVTLGGVMRDVFIEYEAVQMLHLQGQQEQSFILLEEGRKIPVKNVAYHVGGGAANSAVSFSRLGLEVETIFKIGDDLEGAYILNELKKEKISTQHVVHSKDQRTGTSFIIPASDGNKAALVYRGANLTLGQQEIPWKILSTADQIYVTSLSSQASQLLLPITTFAKNHAKSVAVNPGGSQLLEGACTLRDCLPNIDILILNSIEAKQFMLSLVQTTPALQKILLSRPKTKSENHFPQLLQAPLTYQQICFSFPQYFHEILSRGPKIVVVTNGAEGVYVATKDTIYFYPSLPCAIVSTMGAGDAFGSTFVATLLEGKPLEHALVAGIINSCSVIQHLGTQTGLLSKKELESLLGKADMGLLQKFKL